ncbi:ATP-binding protein [Pseudonocardia sp. CA-142604]|uniref:sensor histidine kinase n=1 Tax=Pseudonocardia sp. CA-142604 TaxID=3240024 RepID=UPI003D8EAFD6
MHVPGLALFGLLLRHPPLTVAYVLVTPVVCLAFGYWLRRRRGTASVLVTAGLVYSSAALVGLTGGTIEAHFHFFIIIGFIALYQHWAPFLFNIIFTVISHGIGSAWHQTLIFNHPAAQANPWLWSAIHGVAVLLACVGMSLFWRVTEESQREKDTLSRRLSDAEIGRRQFTSDLLVNLARRNQSMLYRQLDIINQLEESERDPDALAELFKLDHLATRVRRNAESLLVLSGEQPSRTWSAPVPLRDVARAAVAEIEHLERVVLVVDEHPAVSGRSVTDLTHLIAELTENAVRFSPPDTVVTIRSCPDRDTRGGHLVSVEDWGLGMPRDELAATNALLADPPEVDLSVAQRLGFHVVARLSARHGIRVSLTALPGSGLTAMLALPARLFEPPLLDDPPPKTQLFAPSMSEPVSAAPTRNLPAQSAPATSPPNRTVRPTARNGSTPVVGTTRNGSSSARRVPAAPVRRRPPEPVPAPETTWPGWWDRPLAGPTSTTPAGNLQTSGTVTPAEHAPPAAVAVPFPRRPTPTGGTPAPDRFPAITAVTRVPAPRLAEPADPPPPGAALPPPDRPDHDPAGRHTLRRRVPQASLAAGLREPDQRVVPADHNTTTGSADALSRYQAGRRAALAIAENESGGVS